MATLTGPEVYTLALDAFQRAGIEGADARIRAAIATGISKLESNGWDTAARGDTGLQTQKWGPSIGLWQIRSLNAQLGSGGTRDEQANLDPAHNADAMVSISSGGTNWIPWTVWKDQGIRPQVQQIAAQTAADIGLSFTEIAEAGGAVPGTYGLGDITNAVTHPVDVITQAPVAVATGVASIPGLVTDPLKALAQLLSFLLNPAFWRRLGEGALGVALVMAGAYVTITDLRRSANV